MDNFKKYFLFSVINHSRNIVLRQISFQWMAAARASTSSWDIPFPSMLMSMA